MKKQLIKGIEGEEKKIAYYSHTVVEKINGVLPQERWIVDKFHDMEVQFYAVEC
jgi:hypothetical protein